MRQAFFLFLSTAFFILSGCTEPITVGSELLGDDRAIVGQTMELEFTTTVVREDSIITFDASANAALSSFTFGQLRNDAFGELKHSVYIVPSLPRNPSTGLVAPPAFAADINNRVDSIVLFLPVDTSAGLYGNGQTFPIRMTQLAGTVDQNRDYASDVSLVQGFNELQRDDAFSVEFAATLLYDTIISSGDSVLFPHVRIAFDDQFVDLLNDAPASIFESDTTFYEFLAGMYLETTGDNGSLVTLQPQSNTAAQSFSGIYYFYTSTETDRPTFYRTPLSLWLPRYEQDYAGTFFGDRFAPGTDNESCIVAGQAGLMTAITFTDLSALQGFVINEAKLTFFLEEVEGLSYTQFPAPTFTGLFYRNDEGLLINIEDRQRLGNPNNSAAIRQFLGGDPLEDEDGNTFYEPRLSVHMQRMVDGEVPPTVYLRTVPLDRDPARMVLRGPSSPTLPATVVVTFTELE